MHCRSGNLRRRRRKEREYRNMGKGRWVVARAIHYLAAKDQWIRVTAMEDWGGEGEGGKEEREGMGHPNGN